MAAQDAAAVGGKLDAAGGGTGGGEERAALGTGGSRPGDAAIVDDRTAGPALFLPVATAGSVFHDGSGDIGAEPDASRALSGDKGHERQEQ